MSGRFVIEGEWSGYHSGQRQVAHRQVHSGARKKLRAWAEEAGSIAFTDGTRLCLSVRDCKPRERVQQKLGYTSLIEDCFYNGVNSVSALPARRGAA